jgi:hypothetical protein
MARTGTRLSLATLLGHLLRCSYYRAGECRPTGMCKAGWIADVFGVDARNVKAARRALVTLGVLRFERVGQRFLNAHGPLVTLNLDWSPPCGVRDKSPPRPAVQRDGLPPPRSEPKLLRSGENQNPPARRPSGAQTRVQPLTKPSLRHVVAEDLTDTARLASLYAQACENGYVGRSQAERLTFFAMAEHARAVAKRNAPGLFAANVRSRRWGVIGLADEDAARRKLAGLPERRYGPRAPRSGSSPPVGVSADRRMRGEAAFVTVRELLPNVMKRLGRIGR